MTFLVVTACAGIGAPPASAAGPAYRDTKLSFAERATDLVSRLTLREKAAQLGTSNASAIPRLGVQEYTYWSEAQHGVSAFWGGNWFGNAESQLGAANPPAATSFPTNFAASMSWDPALMRRETSAVSDEARGFLDPALFDRSPNNLGPKRGSYGSLFYFNPTVNMGRDPRWGRNDEAFGEDPYFVGTMGSAYVDGFQGQDGEGRLRGKYLKAVATAKHFALNNVEHLRTGISSNTDEATIRDYYTPQFRRLVEDAHVGGLMSSYNAVNGTPAVANSLLLNTLARRTFGLDRYITSDCGGVATTYRRPDAGIGSVNSPLYLAGHDWAPPGWRTDHGGDRATWTGTAGGIKVSGQAGGEAFSLRAGNDINCTGDDSDPSAGPPTTESFGSITGRENNIRYVREAIRARVLSADVLDRALVRVFTLRMRTGEFDPRARQPYTKIKASAIQSRAHRALAEKVATSALVLLKNTRPGRSTAPLLPANAKRLNSVVILGDQADKVFLGGYSGAPTEQISLRRGLTDRIKAANPRATITYDAAGSASTSSTPVRLSDATKRAIGTADLVVVMVGTDGSTNAEGSDREAISMPGNYNSLVDQTAAVGNPRVALVVQSGAMVELGAVKPKVSSILFSGPNGQRQGRAAAAALLGAANPSGRLNFTWFRNLAQLPPMSDYDLSPRKTGGLGRTYQYFTGKPEYRFGYGRSYTTFRWSRIKVDRRHATANGTIRVTATVENTGKRPGADVVQLYAKSPNGAGRDTPIRRLVGFRKTRRLAPNSSQRISIAVPVAATLRLWNRAAKRSRITAGTWRFEVSRSAGEVARSLAVGISGRISRSIARVTVQPPKSTLHVGERLDMRAENRWLQHLGPAGTDPRTESIVAAVRRDDSFVDLRNARLEYRSNRPSIVRVTRRGHLMARRPGVATVTISFRGKSARVAFAVRR